MSIERNEISDILLIKFSNFSYFFFWLWRQFVPLSFISQMLQQVARWCCHHSTSIHYSYEKSICRKKFFTDWQNLPCKKNCRASHNSSIAVVWHFQTNIFINIPTACYCIILTQTSDQTTILSWLACLLLISFNFDITIL